MKTQKIILLIIFFFGLTGVITAQYCNSYAMTKGRVLGYKNFDAKGKLNSSSKITCYDVQVDSTEAIIYKIKTEVANLYGDNVSSREHDLKCINGKLFVAIESLTGLDEEKEFEGMKISVDSKDIEYPETLQVGQTLPDATLTISTTSKGKKKIAYVVKVSNRKVVSNETVTVPIGTFDCFKITYDLEIKTTTNVKYSVNEFMAEGVGQIKSETYTKKGKLQSTSQLTELKK